MGYVISASISDAQKDFMKKHDLSMSSVVQEKLDELMTIQDPELFQKRLGEVTPNKIGTVWQKSLDQEPDFNKRKMIIFGFLDNIGIDTSDWPERIGAERNIKDGVI